MPIAGRRVWGIFLELNATGGAGMAPNPISFSEIETWSRMRREPVRSQDHVTSRCPSARGDTRYNAVMPTHHVRIIRHEAVPESGSFEVRFADGRRCPKKGTGVRHARPDLPRNGPVTSAKWRCC